THTVEVPFPQAFASPKRSPFPSAPRYGMEPGLPGFSEALMRNICPLGENARPSVKTDSYAASSLCATLPVLLGSASSISRDAIHPYGDSPLWRYSALLSSSLPAGSGLFIPRMNDGGFQARSL